MNCPSCASDNTQRFEVVYESGTHFNQSRSGMSGLGVGVGGRGLGVGVGMGSSSTKGVSRSLQAERTAPPEKTNIGKVVIGAIAGAALFLIFRDGLFADIGVAMALGYGVYGAAALYNNSKVYPDRLATWQRSWMCHRCGATFEQLQNGASEHALSTD